MGSAGGDAEFTRAEAYSRDFLASILQPRAPDKPPSSGLSDKRFYGARCWLAETQAHGALALRWLVAAWLSAAHRWHHVLTLLYAHRHLSGVIQSLAFTFCFPVFQD